MNEEGSFIGAGFTYELPKDFPHGEASELGQYRSFLARRLRSLAMAEIYHTITFPDVPFPSALEKAMLLEILYG